MKNQHKENIMSSHQWTRRDILKAGAAALAVPTIVPAHALGLEGAAPPSETPRIGVIGCGGRINGLIGEGRGVKGFRVVSACDLEIKRAEKFAEAHAQGRKWNVYDDFLQMIEKEKLDGVMVETPTHPRAWISILAMQAGVDVYIEKPMCMTIAEGRAVVKAARQLKRVTQVGTQQRSMPIDNWASDLVKNGALGKVKTVLAPNFVGPFRWTKTSSKDVKGPVEPWWDKWLNYTELRPYSPELHRGWARWWDYDGGGISFGVTGWGAHSYDQINRALGTDDTGPVEVLLEEKLADVKAGKYERKFVKGEQYPGLTGDVDTGIFYHPWSRNLVGPRARVTMKFANGTEVKYHLDADVGPGLGAIFFCEKGIIEINRDKLASKPLEIVRSKDNPGQNKRPESAYHLENWIQCIKSRKTCNADIEIGHRANTLCCLVNIVRDVGRVGEVLRWDPVAERFTNCDEGNKMLTRERRQGYELPRIG